MSTFSTDIETHTKTAREILHDINALLIELWDSSTYAMPNVMLVPAGLLAPRRRQCVIPKRRGVRARRNALMDRTLSILGAFARKSPAKYAFATGNAEVRPMEMLK